jgi:hypothetical protein
MRRQVLIGIAVMLGTFVLTSSQALAWGWNGGCCGYRPYYPPMVNGCCYRFYQPPQVYSSYYGVRWTYGASYYAPPAYSYFLHRPAYYWPSYAPRYDGYFYRPRVAGWGAWRGRAGWGWGRRGWRR